MLHKSLLLAFALLLTSFCHADTGKDSLLLLINTVESDEEKIKPLIAISVLHSDLLELDSALMYGHRALDIAKSLDQPMDMGDAYYTLGYAMDLNGKLDDALEFYDLARIEFLKTDNDINIVKAMNGRGVAAFFAGDFGKALQFYQETLAYAEKKDMKREQANLLRNIANIYRRNTARYPEALKMNLRASEIYSELQDSSSILQSLYAIAITYMDLEDFDNAKMFFDSSIYYCQVLGDTTILGMAYNELGHSYLVLKKDYPNARKYLLQAREYLKSSNQQGFVYRNLMSIGKIDTAQGKYLSAERYFQEAYDYVADTDRDELKASAFEVLRDVQWKSGKYKLAYQNSLKYEEIQNRLKSTEREKFVEELQTKYDTDQKQKQIEIQNLKLDQAANQKQTYILILGLLGVSVLSLIGFLYNKNRTNKILNDQNDQIQKSLSEKEILLREIHHRVKNNLQVISSLLKLQSRTIDDDAALSALQEGQNRVKSMALIHQNLYQEDNLTGVDVKDYFEKLTRHLFDSYKTSTEEIDLKLDICDIRLDVDTVIPLGLILNELVSNALKYAFETSKKGTLSIRLYESGDQLILQVHDDGKGLDQSKALDKSASFGYSMIHTFAEQLDGDLVIKGDEGTDVSLTLDEYRKVA